MLGTAIANAPVTCGPEEIIRVIPPGEQTCDAYLSEYINGAGGYIVDPSATSECQFCALNSTNVFLDNFSIKYSNRWRDFGIIWVYIAVNVAAAFGFYWLARVVSYGT
jgi:ABC-type multidrug transport system permease subunit